MVSAAAVETAVTIFQVDNEDVLELARYFRGLSSPSEWRAFSLLANSAEADIGGSQKMTLKIYDKLDDVPEGLRGEYKQSGNKYVPDLSDDHPVLVLSKTLKQEKEVEEAKVKKLRSDLDDALEAAKTSGVPRGQTLVAKADAELIDKYKALGKVEDVQAKLTEHESLKLESDKRKTDDNNRAAARELGYNADALLLLKNLPEFEIREKDGKKAVVVKIKDGENIVEKPAKEFIESTYAASMPALTAKAGVELPVGGGSGSEGSGKDPLQWAKDFAKEYVEQTKPIADPYKAFNERQSA